MHSEQLSRPVARPAAPGFALAAWSAFLWLAAAAPQAAADESRWTFDDPADRLTPDAGPAMLDYYDPFATAWGPSATAFDTATGFGLPAMADGDPDVMSFPACGPDEGYQLTHASPANGVFVDDGYVSNYSLVLDVLFPAASDGFWRSLYQTSPANSNDGELFVLDQPSGGIGIASRYHGSIRPDTWHRVVVTVRAAPGEGQLHKFIDGTFVGGQGTTGSAIDSRWALEDSLLLFADENGDTAAGFVAGVMFVDRQLTMDEVKALGGPSAAGPHLPGPPAADPYPYQLTRSVDIIAHRGNSCCAPENTLPALAQAFDAGARYIECDTRLTSDGVAVFMHDATVDRTTDGTGAVSAMTLAELNLLDAGSWFDPAYAGTRVPTLEEALALAKAEGGTLYLDLKVTGAGPAIKASLASAGVAEDDIWLWVSNNAAEAAALRVLMPTCKIIWGEPPGTWPTDPTFWDTMRGRGVFGFDLGSGTGNISQRFALAAREEGFYISNYTILDPESMIQSAANGANGIENDFPDILRQMQPPYSIEFYNPEPITQGTPLGPAQLDAAADIPGTFTYDPPAGTVMPTGEHPVTATFQPDDAGAYPPRSVTVNLVVGSTTAATFELDKAEYLVDEPITATWTGAPGNPTDWVGVYSNPGCGPVAEEFVCGSTIWLYVSGSQSPFDGVVDGSVVFDFPGLPQGDYIAYLLREDGYGWIADPVPFRVNDVRPSITSFTADPALVPEGGTSTLSWTIDPRGNTITRVWIDSGVGDVATNGSVDVETDFSTTYTLIVESAAGEVFAEVQVLVEIPTEATFALDKSEYRPDEPITATWTGAPGIPTDWVGVYSNPGCGPVAEAFVCGSTIWLYVSGSQTAAEGVVDGSVTFDFPGLPVGDYIAYFLQEDGYFWIANPVPFRVAAEPPPAVPFVITGVAFDGDDLLVTWNSVGGRTYRIDVGAALTAWDEADDDVTATGTATTYRLTGFRNSGNRFVRVAETAG